jgi:hypothetical protein
VKNVVVIVVRALSLAMGLACAEYFGWWGLAVSVPLAWFAGCGVAEWAWDR